MEPLNPQSCFSVLLGISRALSQRTSIQKTVEIICSHVETYFNPRHLAFLLVDPTSGDLAFNYVLGELAPTVEGRRLRKGKGIAGWVADSSDPLLIENTSTDPRFAAQFLTAKTKNSKSIMAVPLKSGDTVYGVLEVFDNRDGLIFTKANLMDLMAIADITAVAVERAYYFQAMKRMSETDHLTGLPNKRSYDRYMEREIEVCKRYGTPSSVLELHVDKIRKLNEEYGVAAVDKLLQNFAGIVTNEVRKVDITCRIGANRFVVVMPNTTRRAAMEVADRLQAKLIEQRAIRHLPSFTVTHTIHSGTQEDVTELLAVAEVNKIGTQGFRKFRNVAANLYILLNEERQAQERRQYYRKRVKLPGRYESPDTGECGEFLLENLSLNGLGFTALQIHGLIKGTLLRIKFQLDDVKRTEISRIAQVRYLDDRYVGCQFVDQKSYDGDLGFYLMR